MCARTTRDFQVDRIEVICIIALTSVAPALNLSSIRIIRCNVVHCGAELNRAIHRQPEPHAPKNLRRMAVAQFVDVSVPAFMAGAELPNKVDPTAGY
jgi:hypothetical protein